MYQALRRAIKEEQFEAIVIVHDFIVIKKKWWMAEGEYYHLVELAAKMGDIATFRTVIHLTALNLSQHPNNPVPLLEPCEKAHHDAAWFMLKRALSKINNVVDPLSPAKEQKAVRLVSFIVAQKAVRFDMSTGAGLTLMQAVIAGNLRRVKYFLQRGDIASNDDLWKAEWLLRHVKYNVRVFEQWKNDAALIALYHAYQLSNAHHGRTKVMLKRLVKHVEPDAELKTRVKQWAKTKTTDRDMELLDEAKHIASNQPVVAVPENIGDRPVSTTLACGARGPAYRARILSK
ncbi:hypothetical protein P171DRAFT_139852 [Karstenula rhodostoma CBS 690.94]|uniref:Uncharacterized protein n=1 Tax=Karstenula rhodostoma CBS 690.94 TaxID=1392251 RepID=A0A9P4UHA6_9PLEO|nr:hypothetical protein P171DRAFT_139852 [Karstenula rhodostoma CBS 690.94]